MWHDGPAGHSQCSAMEMSDRIGGGLSHDMAKQRRACVYASGILTGRVCRHLPIRESRAPPANPCVATGKLASQYHRRPIAPHPSSSPVDVVGNSIATITKMMSITSPPGLPNPSRTLAEDPPCCPRGVPWDRRRMRTIANTDTATYCFYPEYISRVFNSREVPMSSRYPSRPA
jgi:hypothetical protein